MEQDKYLPCIAVEWMTKKPSLGQWFRSPYFHLDEYEVCLELESVHYTGNHYIETRVVWRSTTPSEESRLYSCCYVTAGSQVLFSGERDTLKKIAPCKLVDLILRDSIGKCSAEVLDREWTVICQLSLDKPFHEQNERKRIRLMTVDDPSISVDKCVQVSMKIPRKTVALCNDYARLLKQEILPDCKLSCGGQSFPVHRCVLAARSEVFRAMFSNQMQESKAGLVVIEDLEVPVLKLFLKFVYSGELDDVSADTASQLYEAADKYAVKSLMTACSEYMIRNVTVENCLGYLKTANSHSDAFMKASVELFIVRHPSVFNSNAWATFSEQEPVMANKILQAYIT